MFQREKGHEGYAVNCVYWDDLGYDRAGNLLPTTCLVIGPFFLHDEESTREANEVKTALVGFKLWSKTHLVVVGY